MKDIAPSNEIRKQFNHQAENAARFRQQYLQELDTDPQAKEFAKECHVLLAKKNITLLYSARDEQYNNAVILKEWLERN